MDLAKALLQQGVSQRELGRRLGYSSNGAISGVLEKRIGVPADDIPKWADALGLTGEDRQSFIDFYAEIAIPKWYRERLEAAELQVVEHRVKSAELSAKVAALTGEAAILRAKIYKITVKRNEPRAK